MTLGILVGFLLATASLGPILAFFTQIVKVLHAGRSLRSEEEGISSTSVETVYRWSPCPHDRP